ncbi:T9SS type B sorting domain-containing protein [Winogradskyella alexanderae]|uniref:T9SS type B sorting domain-containing protein n=1 Tax=Winogradskyella alexanderae TaxID=2877123 RepID=A0ABS7XXY4_9FLAO|nr:T9SS type B sorting domain-containing protein [Winogradskyella alexanderae]MCA0133676.1 T9SS type B sorting domain-containing protein [Winogradskyella alexanderae]
MKKKSIYIFLFFFAHLTLVFAQQIVTDSSLQPQQLINDLIGESCIIATNVSSNFNGQVNNISSFGSFERGNSNFPLASGLVLSTGSVNSTGNAFIPQSLSEGEINWNTDPEIQNVLGIDQTLNATSIEFNLVAANSFVAFKYLFASDEYQQDYPCSFQDVFAILIRPTGSNEPYTNIALVPNTAIEVSTSSIRPNIDGFCEAQNEAYFLGYDPIGTNFNASTTVLTATTSVIPGAMYDMKFVIADHIDQRFDSAVFIEADSFGDAIDLGPDQAVCGNELVLNADINNNQAIYAWYRNGVQINDANTPTLQVTESGIYDVEITLPIAGGTCTLEDAIEIDVLGFESAAPIPDMTVCDPAPSDGIYDFDFTLRNDDIFDNLLSEDYIISYYTSLEDAETNNNGIDGIYQNTEDFETIYFRIESLDDSCLQIGSFDVIIKPAPNTRIIDPIIVCEELYIPSISSVDFEFYDFWVADFEFNRTVTFHYTEEEAELGENAIPSPYPYPEQTETLYARVVDDFNGCHSVVPFTMEFNESPFVGQDRFIINKCTPIDEFYEDAEEIYNLNEAVEQITEWIPEPRVNYFPSVEDALSQTNAFLFVGDPILTLTTNQLTIYMTIAEQGGYCTSIVPLELHKNVTRNVIGPNTIVNRCDDPSNDGVFDFDLNVVTEELIGGYADLTLIFYETAEDQQNGTNPLDINTPFTINTNNTELFLKVKYKNECEDLASVTLRVNDVPTLEPQTADACGSFNPNDGTTTVNLRYYRDIMSQNTPSPSVKFYETYENADNDENEITETYDILGNSQQFFARVSNSLTGCYSITTLDINVVESLDFQSPEPLIFCDDDQDGFTTINLFNVLPTISTELDDFTTQFYTSFGDAFGDRNPITNPSNYASETETIFVRLERAELNCFAIVDFEVRVFNNPQNVEIQDFIECQIDLNEVSGFVFQEKDDSIINGQEDMQVSYYENETDAINSINPIDKTLPYQNTSNPQTIFVRVENENQNSCVAISPMQIEIRQAPVYNSPTNIPVCGTNGSGPYQIDLNEKVDEISLGSPLELNISFHTTELNANLGTNPVNLNYTSTSNPEKLYARIVNNASGCYSIETFNINILDLPNVNFNQSLTKCGNYFESNLPWDLTEIELDILDGRQYNVDFTYYHSEADAENEINPITDPENYTSNGLNETIYTKVRNVSTSCFIIVPFNLNINLPPAINEIESYTACETESNNIDLGNINSHLVDINFNVVISYHSNQEDADNNENALNYDFNYNNNSELLFARVAFSTTKCYTVHPFTLNIVPNPVAFQPNNIEECDDDNDGLLTVDLNQQTASILNGQNPNEFEVTYFITEVDAIENTNHLEVQYTATNNEIIYARVEHIETRCFAITSFEIIINVLPFASIQDQVLCLNNLPLLVSAETNNPGDTYQWSTNENSSVIEITEIGTYSVTITNTYGCSKTSTFNVTESESAIIEFVETIDFSDPNNITVTINGIGDYLYILNDGPPQFSNTFNNVPIGYNTITVIDQNGCDRTTREVLVIDTPKHLTPNNDGDFDTWHITGAETLPGTIVRIFNRYGKLLKELNHNSLGWDGTFNGTAQPAGDYWYIADVIQNGESFQIKGHFALRR